MYPPSCNDEIKEGIKCSIEKWTETIAEKQDGANGQIFEFRSAQTVKISPLGMPRDALSAIYVTFVWSSVARRLRSLSTATTLQPNAAKATAFRPYPHGASSTSPLPEDAISLENLRRVFEGEIGNCAVFTAKKRPVCGRCTEFLRKQRTLRNFPSLDSLRTPACTRFSNR